MPKTRRPRGFEISDRKRFGRLMVQLIEKRGGSDKTGKKCAENLQLSPATFSRLEAAGAVERPRRPGGRRRGASPKGQTNRFSGEVMRKLEDALGAITPGLGLELASCVMSAAGRRFYDRTYLGWCQERLARFERAPGRLYRASADEKPWRVQARENRFWRKQLLSDLAGKAKRSEDTRRLVEKYRVQMARMGVAPERWKVAVLRTVEPLAEWMAMGCLQRRWRDLSKEERQAFVESGLRRELILVEGEHPQRRVARWFGV